MTIIATKKNTSYGAASTHNSSWLGENIRSFYPFVLYLRTVGIRNKVRRICFMQNLNDYGLGVEGKASVGNIFQI